MENFALYQLYEWQRAAKMPIQLMSSWCNALFSHSSSLSSHSSQGRYIAAGFGVLERLTRHYAKPRFGIREVEIDGKTVAVENRIVKGDAFCHLRHFKRHCKRKNDPKILVVAPMSGHHATLLRGTVRALIPHAEVYITDWVDAKDIPVMEGKFDLDDYVEKVRDCIRHIGKDTHVVAVCQPAVPVLAAVSLMNEDKDPYTPSSMTLMGGPIDTRQGPTQVNEVAKQRSLQWFEHHVITRIPFNHPGFMRRVYPGFLQLSGFMTMNLDRHIDAHVKLFQHLVDGDGDSAEAHRKFYDEYLSVADITAEFYLMTIDKVFQRHLLPKGEFNVGERIVKPECVTETALLCIEGERDDISGVGQTKAALDLCRNLPEEKKHYHLQPATGHYGIFNGRKYREQIAPLILEHIHQNGKK